MKLGKKSPIRLMKTPALGDFLPKATEWPAVAPRGWEYAVPSDQLQCLGNDLWGDCAEAAAVHFIQVETANSGNPLHGTLQQTLDLYSTLTGFDPNAGPSDNNPTDQGTALISLLQYWKTTGITVTDSSGNAVVHKILGWASLDLSSVAQMRYANDLFGGMYLGINCPQSAETDPTNWTYQAGSPIVGGHCINGTGQGGAGAHIQSWGTNIPTDWEFLLNYLDEGYCIVSENWISSNGKSPSGLDLNGLLSAMTAL